MYDEEAKTRTVPYWHSQGKEIFWKKNSKGSEKVGKGGNSIEGMFHEELRYLGERHRRIHEW